MGWFQGIAGFLVALLLLSSDPEAEAASFWGLGDRTWANGVSADGSVVVGYSNDKNTLNLQAFRWTEATGVELLGDLPGGELHSWANAASGDGSVIVGAGTNASNKQEAFRWTDATGMQGLGDLPNGQFLSEAHDVSSDGSIIVGNSQGSNGLEAFRWTDAAGMVGLGDLPGGSTWSSAQGISADGSVIVGASISSGVSGYEAFRWTDATGMQGLGDLPGGNFQSWANAVSADGSTIVGYGTNADDTWEAFRWTDAIGMVGLGDLPGGITSSTALDVSGDGSAIVGWSTTDRFHWGSWSFIHEAFIWDANHGMRSLQDVLVQDYGLGSALNGWFLLEATGISDDGLTIVGRGINTNKPVVDVTARDAWVVRLDPPAPHPVPEPNTMLLFGIGLVMLIGSRWIQSIFTAAQRGNE